MTAQLHEVLALIEQELHALGWWEQQAPTPEALASCEPFCVDTLSFAQWLQWVLLPRMQELLYAQQPLPQNSAIAAMAEVLYAGQGSATDALQAALGRFDQLLAVRE